MNLSPGWSLVAATRWRNSFNNTTIVHRGTPIFHEFTPRGSRAQSDRAFTFDPPRIIASVIRATPLDDRLVRAVGETAREIAKRVSAAINLAPTWWIERRDLYLLFAETERLGKRRRTIRWRKQQCWRCLPTRGLRARGTAWRAYERLLGYCRAARSVTADTIRRLYRLVRHVQPHEPANLPTCLSLSAFCPFPSTPSRDTVRPPEAFTWRTPNSREHSRSRPTILCSNFTAGLTIWEGKKTIALSLFQIR